MVHLTILDVLKWFACSKLSIKNNKFKNVLILQFQHPRPSFSHMFFFPHCCSAKLFLRDPAAPARTPTTALFIRDPERSRCRVPPNSSKCFTMCSPSSSSFLTQLWFDPFLPPVESEQTQIFLSKVTHVGARGDTLKSNLIICVSPVCLHWVSARLLSSVHGCSCANKVLAVKGLGWMMALIGRA